MKFKAFWIVWSPQGKTPPSVRHETEGDANTEARRLAHEHRGSEFYVLESTGMARTTDVAWFKPSSLPDEEDMPF